MSKQESNEDLKHDRGHEYDGIREYDYPAPKWWQAIFYGSIFWAVGYFAYYHVFEGETLRHQLDRELVDIEREKLKAAANGPSDGDLMALVSKPEIVKAGKETFMSKCASCHGDQGQGIIGPNLTDQSWIHGAGTAADIFKVVDKGVADKGMPPWGPILAPAELKSVVAYVKTLQGTKPTNPKAPQGTEVKL